MSSSAGAGDGAIVVLRTTSTGADVVANAVGAALGANVAFAAALACTASATAASTLHMSKLKYAQARAREQRFAF